MRKKRKGEREDNTNTKMGTGIGLTGRLGGPFGDKLQ